MVKLVIPGTPIAKAIPNYEDYLAFSNGEIYSIRSKKYLKQGETKDGYLKVTLWKNNKGTTRKTHRFIAETFIPNPSDKPQINHINGDKKDNNISNLEWVTGEENMKHAIKLGLVNSDKAKHGWDVKLKKYGKEYLSKVATQNGSKANREKANNTKLEKYGKQHINRQALKASKVAQKVNYKQTQITDTYNRKSYLFESRKEASIFIGLDQRRISESIKNGRLIKERYIAKDVCNG